MPVISLKKLLLNIIKEAMDIPPAEIRPSHHFSNFSSNYINFIKNLENAGLVGYNKQKKLWFPHPSPEGKYPTIGYGHKIKSDSELQRLNLGISNSEVERLLKQDLEEAKDKVNSYIKRNFKINIVLDQDRMEMLTEFAFNLGSLNVFPKFTEAVLKKDWNWAKKEYKRYYTSEKTGKSEQLTRRNNLFFNKYLKNK